MTNHTASYFADPDMAIPGHNSHLVYVHQTKVTGLHCEDCYERSISAPGSGEFRHHLIAR